MKLCKDCKFIRYEQGRECGKRSFIIDLVDGEVVYPLAAHMRGGWLGDGWLGARLSGTCGKEGRWWEAK